MGKWYNNLWSFHTMEYFLVIKKEQTIATRDYLDESPETYAEWKKPIPKRYTLFDSIYIIFSKWENGTSGEQIFVGDRAVHGHKELAGRGSPWW